MALQLLVKQQKDAGPIVDIRWCLSKNILDKLQQMGVPTSFIQVLIVVAYENGQEERELRPLNEIQTQMSLYFPGKHKMFARLVWPVSESAQGLKKIRNKLLSKNRPHSYLYSVLNHDQDDFNTDLGVGESNGIGYSEFLDEILDSCTVNIEVDKEHFAPEPPAWLKRWCNLWFPYKSPDQCAFGKRKFLAFSLQPVVMSAYFFWLMAFHTILWIWSQFFLGLRGVSVSTLFHPWRTEVDDFFPAVPVKYGRMVRSSWFLLDKDGNETPWRLFFNPGIYVLLVSVTSIVRLANPTMTWMQAFLTVGGVILAFCTVIAVIVFGVWLDESGRWQRLMNRADTWIGGVLDRRIGSQNLDSMAEEIQNALVCATATRISDPTDLTSLPKQARTVRLRFLHVKAKMCKPFAG